VALAVQASNNNRLQPENRVEYQVLAGTTIEALDVIPDWAASLGEPLAQISKLSPELQLQLQLQLQLPELGRNWSPELWSRAPNWGFEDLSNSYQ